MKISYSICKIIFKNLVTFQKAMNAFKESILFNFINFNFCFQFREHNGVEPLVNLLYSPSDDVRRSVSWALTLCAIDEPTAMEVSKHG